MQSPYQIAMRLDVKTPMRDGVALSADLYLPRAAGPVPTILIRTPYSNNTDPLIEQGRRLAANGYRDITRLASGDPIMHRDICLTNKESIVHWIDECIKELYGIRNQINDDEKALEKTFISTWEARTRWLAGESGERRPGEEMPRASDSMMSLLMGDRLAKRMRDLTDREDKDKTKYRKV